VLQKDETIGRTPPGFFSDLDDQERIRLFNTGTIRTLAGKELLFKKGSSGKTIYCVLSGALIVESHPSDALGFRFSAGDLISETGLAAGQGRISSVIAEEASSVFSLDPAAFATLGAETRTVILKRLHDTVLSRLDVVGKHKESARFREAALTRYLK
jgi:CRP-like cAMP-binding protein